MSDIERVDAWRNLLLAKAAVMEAIEADLASAGVIELNWYDVLLELNAAPDRRLRMQDLGDRVVLSRSRVSRLVDDLERAELVERLADTADGRATLAHLTAAGRRAFRRAAPVYLASIERHFTAQLTTAEIETVATALGRVVSRAGRP